MRCSHVGVFSTFLSEILLKIISAPFVDVSILTEDARKAAPYFGIIRSKMVPGVDED